MFSQKFSFVIVCSLCMWLCVHVAVTTAGDHINQKNDIIIRDKKMYIYGKEFIVKGMAYNPTPLGMQDMTSEGSEGTGYCSPRITVSNQWKSACFARDYLDSSSASPLRAPPGPIKGWWESTWRRDFPILKQLGVNTLRLYNMSPYTKTYFELFPNSLINSKHPNIAQAAEHRKFLDYCITYGLKAIVPIVNGETFLLESDEETIKRVIDAHVEELGNHDSLIMWTVGNDLKLHNNNRLRDIVNMYLEYVRERMMKRWKRTVPVTTVVGDEPLFYDMLARELKVDLFMSNKGIRGGELESLLEGESNATDSGWKFLSKKYNIPWLFGEMSFRSIGNGSNVNIPDWFNRQYSQVISHVDEGCIGTVFFEYNDQYSNSNKSRDMGCVQFELRDVNGRTSRTRDVFMLDRVVPKEVIFNSIKNGHDESPYRKFNFNSDTFELIGRKQTNIKLNITDDSSGTTSDEDSSEEIDSMSGVQPTKTKSILKNMFTPFVICLLIYFN